MLSRLKLHILFWLLLIFYEVGVIYSYTFKLSHPFDYLGHYALNISIFYFNSHFVLNRTLGRKEPSYTLLLLVIAELIVYLILKYVMISGLILINVPLSDPFTPFRLFLTEGIWRAVYFLGLSTAYWFGLSTVKQQKKINTLQKQQLEDELKKHDLENAYLQAQINPHFLFNSLNFLYNTVNKLSSKASQTVLLLSDMMRYALNEPQADRKVELEEELIHIRNFVQLAQMRHENELNIQLEQHGDPENLRIIPLALITLVENVFKYADLRDKFEPAFIAITIKENTLDLIIQNKKRAADYPHGHGIGVKNVKKRLDTYYPGNYNLTIQNQEDSYNLHLTINL